MNKTTPVKWRECANCRAPLPHDYSSDNRYCASCTAKWQRGSAPANQAGAAPTIRHCPNCKALLPADHPADNPYCAKCTARWWAGRAAQEKREAK